MKIKIALTVALLSSVACAATTTPPKVVFIGDYFTYNWKTGFASNPNWINKGANGTNYLGQKSDQVLARFQSDVISLHPAIVHIMVGAIDSELTNSHSIPYAPPDFQTNLDAMVKQAKAANIKVILGVSPGTAEGYDFIMPQLNAIIEAYGAVNNIQVVNYADALCQCVGSLGQNTEAFDTFQQPDTSIPGLVPNTPTLLPTAAGYALMTTLAETAVANEYLTIWTGWLSNVTIPSEDIGVAPASNVNTVLPGETIQFTPVGYYSDGNQRPQINTNTQGASGTWTSSNPLVMSVNERGLALGLTPGTTSIRFTLANGVKFSPWVITVN